MVGDGSWKDDWKGQAGMTSRKLGVTMEEARRIKVCFHGRRGGGERKAKERGRRMIILD